MNKKDEILKDSITKMTITDNEMAIKGKLKANAFKEPLSEYKDICKELEIDRLRF